jgi:hypothetical protein
MIWAGAGGLWTHPFGFLAWDEGAAVVPPLSIDIRRAQPANGLERGSLEHVMARPLNRAHIESQRKARRSPL